MVVICGMGALALDQAQSLVLDIQARTCQASTVSCRRRVHAAALSLAAVLGAAPAFADGANGSATKASAFTRPLLPKQRRSGMHQHIQHHVDVAPDDGRFQRGEHGLYLELVGAGGLYSFNYEYRPSEHVALRAGMGVFSGLGSAFWVFPLAVTALVGGRDHYLELGGGVTVVAEESYEPQFPLVPQIGYRYMDSSSRWLLRVMFTPWLGRGDSDIGLLPFGGFSIGATF